jgi:HD-like signal output (HDOD) protein
MSNRAKVLVEEVDGLLTLPSVYFEIRRLIESPNTDIIEVAKAISTDVALTARLLRIVNSPIYAQSRPVVTISRAVSLLGMNQVHDLCLAACLATTFSKLRPRLMDVAGFWHHSLLRAIATRKLGRQSRSMDLERLFILGLLSDIGHMVIYMRIPEEAARLIGQMDAATVPLHRIEQQHLHCDYAEVGAALLQRWRLPDSIWLPIAQQTAPEPGKPHALESALLNIIGAAIQARTNHGDLLVLSDPAAWEITALTPEQVIEALAHADETIDGMPDIFTDQKAA